MEAHTADPALAATPSRLGRLSLLRAAGDDRLVRAIRDGDERAFEVVYDRHHRPLLSFCRHMLISPQEAEDAVQQTFLNAYKSLRDGDGEREIDLRPWLYRIARNHCVSVLRRRREEASDEIEISTIGLSPQVEQREDLRAMLADLAQLPPDQREALVLSELGTISHTQIAEILDCRPEKVKALVFRARKSLGESREAREISCQEVREQLSILRGGSLRRSVLSKHVRGCEGCQAFRDEVRRQRAAVAVLLPVVPSIALKAMVVPSAAAAAGLIAGAAGGGGAAASAGLASKLAAVAATGALATGGAVAVDRADLVKVPIVHQSKSQAPSAPPSGGATNAPPPSATPPAVGAGEGEKRARKEKSNQRRRQLRRNRTGGPRRQGERTPPGLDARDLDREGDRGRGRGEKGRPEKGERPNREPRQQPRQVRGERPPRDEQPSGRKGSPGSPVSGSGCRSECRERRAAKDRRTAKWRRQRLDPPPPQRPPDARQERSGETGG